jgi:hypothetical protein
MRQFLPLYLIVKECDIDESAIYYCFLKVGTGFALYISEKTIRGNY